MNSKSKIFRFNEGFILENGIKLQNLSISYQTWGKINQQRDNVIWVFHALTANADAADWWKGLIGEGKTFDPNEHFIICANIIGSPYGSTSPLSINPDSGQSWFMDFPFITIRDMVNAHKLLKEHLGIDKIKSGLGGSMGGYQLLEWAYQDRELFEEIILVASSAKESPWGIAVHTAHRKAIEADPTWNEAHPEAGKNGLKAARAIGMLFYRNYHSFHLTQKEQDEDTLDNFKASSYLEYQGDKLANRFNVHCYYILMKAMDSHNLARGRNKSLEACLSEIDVPSLIVGIKSDLLCPITDQKFLARNMGNARLSLINSDYGHDGFLVEAPQIADAIQNFRKEIATGVFIPQTI